MTTINSETLKTATYLINTDEPFRGSVCSIVIDGKVAYTDGLTVAEYAEERGKKVKEITAEELDAMMADFEASMATEPLEITEERFREMLEILPPCKWHTTQGVEMFHISERIYGNMVSWFARSNNRYFEFTGRDDLDPLTIARMIHSTS